MRLHFLPVAFLLLSACAPTTVIVDETSTQSSSLPESSAASESSVSGIAYITPEEALDREFTSQHLGISFRYPSTMYDIVCEKELPVEAREGEFSVELVPTEVFDGDCQQIVDAAAKESRQKDLTATIYAGRATTDADIRQFIDRVFSPDCIIAEQSEYEGITKLFLTPQSPPINAPDFVCSEVIDWNKGAGVAVFSSLGSKTGGGIDWFGKRPFLSSDGTYPDYARDFAIMQSIHYLPR